MRPLILVVVACALCGVGSARAADPDDGDVLYARVGAVTAGKQGTLQHGLELGAGWDVPLGPHFVVGLGVGFARERERYSFADRDMRLLSFDAHTRASLGDARIRPVLELGLGYYRYKAHRRYDEFVTPREVDIDWGAPGGSLGIGVQVRLWHALHAQVGMAHHIIVPSNDRYSASFEDYNASGLTLGYVLP